MLRGYRMIVAQRLVDLIKRIYALRRVSKESC